MLQGSADAHPQVKGGAGALAGAVQVTSLVWPRALSPVLQEAKPHLSLIWQQKSRSSTLMIFCFQSMR